MSAFTRSSYGSMLTLLALSGCASAPGNGGGEQLAWTHEKLWSTGGGSDSRLSLSELYPFQVDVSAQGQIRVLGWKEHRVYVLSSTGEVVDSFGRQGAGPGEIEDALALTSDGGDTLYAVDLGLRRVARWAPDGTPLTPISVTWRLDHPKMAFRSGRIWYQTVASVGEGRAEIQLISRAPTDSQVVARVPRELRRVVDFLSCGGREISVQPFFAPTLKWVANAAGVAVAVGQGYDIELYRADGRQLRIHRDLPVIVATEGAALRAAENYQFNGCLVPAAEAVASVGYLPTIPRIVDLALAPTGEVWVLRRSDDGMSNVADLFGSDGGFMGTLPAGIPFPAAFLNASDYLVAEKDSTDVPVVAAYRMTRVP